MPNAIFLPCGVHQFSLVCLYFIGNFRPKNFWFRHACVVGMNLKYNIDRDQKKPVSTMIIRGNEITQKMCACTLSSLRPTARVLSATLSRFVDLD